MKIIVSTHYNRPYYTKRCVSALESAIGIQDYMVYFHVDPGSQDVVDILSNSKLNKEICVNSIRRGFGYNMVSSFTHGFSSDNYVILVEDDIVLGKDALLYFEYARRFGSDKNVFSATAYSRRTHIPHSNDYFRVATRHWYHGWGSALWVDRWMMLLNHGVRWNTMDVDIVKRILGNKKEVYPILSRCQNIGIVNGLNAQNTTTQRYADRIHLKYWSKNVLLEESVGKFHE